MKLRLKNNSIRLRLTKDEIGVLRETGCIEEMIEFGSEPHQRFFYRIESSAATKTMRASFENKRITIFLPKKQADEWTNTARIGVKSSQEIGDGKILRLLIEKDFVRLEDHHGEN